MRTGHGARPTITRMTTVAALAMLVALASPLSALARHDGPVGTDDDRAVGASGVPAVRAVTPPPRPSFGEPRFVLNALRFRAVDESGIDSPGSDEVFAVWQAPGDPMAASVEFTDVDAGETRTFAPRQSCITPIQATRNLGDASSSLLMAAEGDQWACRVVGRSAPIDFTVWLFEHDEDWWLDNCFSPPSPTPEECEDDLIGEKSITLTIADLLAVLPHVGNMYEETITLGGPCGHVEPTEVCGYSDLFPTGPEYTLTYRITRAADADPVLAPNS